MKIVVHLEEEGVISRQAIEVDDLESAIEFLKTIPDESVTQVVIIDD